VKKQTRKMSLSRETLRQMEINDITQVAGGAVTALACTVTCNFNTSSCIRICCNRCT
jgi:hypothetical protein